MAVYDRKLGDWFKEVEQIAQELRAKKQHKSAPDTFEETDNVAKSIPSEAEIASPTVAASPAGTRLANEGDGLSVRQLKTEPVTRSVALAENVEETQSTSTTSNTTIPALFEDAEIPQVEDFLPFLDKPETPKEHLQPKAEQRNSVVRAEQRSIELGEGTGIPRPVTNQDEAVLQTSQPGARTGELPLEHQTAPTPTKPRSSRAPRVELKSSVQAQQSRTKSEQSIEPSAEEKWARVPSHLRTLFEAEIDEVAQRSYKTFKESRAELIERLLDPTITLEDTARLLNVCPTTVRRYTNKGILKHFRTPGNQRRFKLSDVIAFLESRRSGQAATSPKEPESTE